MKYFLLWITFILFQCQITAQNNTVMDTLPYYEIPSPPSIYTAGAVAARTIDGLGYRYYWATKDIGTEVLNYEPGNEGRKTADVLEHLYGLSKMILNATLNRPNVRSATDDNTPTEFDDLRAATLRQLAQASQLLRQATDSELDKMNIIFQRGDQVSTFPFWNLLNGPIDDALTHVGQIISYRRSAGFPQNPKVNVFMGKNRL